MAMMLNNKRERSKEENASTYKNKLLDLLNNELENNDSMLSDYIDITNKEGEIIQIYLKVIKQKFEVSELCIIGFVDMTTINELITTPSKAYEFYRNIEAYFELFSMNTDDENNIINYGDTYIS